MDIFLYNFSWMAYNIYLALVAVLFGLFLFRMPNKFYSLLLGIVWFAYLPNTIYVVTDVHHLIEQWPRLDPLWQALSVVQYGIFVAIGLACYLVAFYPLEKMLQGSYRREKWAPYIIIAVNFILGLALVVGKFLRVNSWDLFISPGTAINGFMIALRSDDLLGLALLFGLFANFFYFLFRDKTIAFMSKRFDHNLMAPHNSLPMHR
jgi:uncharacterized membrane protein